MDYKNEKNEQHLHDKSDVAKSRNTQSNAFTMPSWIAYTGFAEWGKPILCLKSFASPFGAASGPSHLEVLPPTPSKMFHPQVHRIFHCHSPCASQNESGLLLPDSYITRASQETAILLLADSSLGYRRDSNSPEAMRSTVIGDSRHKSLVLW